MTTVFPPYETLAACIEKAASGETICACVIAGDNQYLGYRNIDPRDYDGMTDRVLTWEEARPLLSYAFSMGCDRGRPGDDSCHAVVAWTDSKVIFISTYDGSAQVESLPRNPVDFHPVQY